MKLRILLIVIILFSGQSFSASYDCKKASTTVEKQICSDELLSKLDEDLSKIYSTLLKITYNTDELRIEQIAWLKESRNTCKGSECIRKTYSERIEFLKNKYSAMKENFEKIGSKILDQRGIHIGISQADLVKRLEYGQFDYGMGASCDEELGIPNSTNSKCILAGYPLALYPEGCFSLSGEDGTIECERGAKITNGMFLNFYIVDEKVVKIEVR